MAAVAFKEELGPKKSEYRGDLHPAAKIRVYDGFAVEPAEHDTPSAVVGGDFDPHPFGLAAALLDEFDFDVVAGLEHVPLLVRLLRETRILGNRRRVARRKEFCDARKGGGLSHAALLDAYHLPSVAPE